jgi:hypothetical protein
MKRASCDRFTRLLPAGAAGVFLLALSVRMLALALWGPLWWWDCDEYRIIAVNWLAGKGFLEGFQSGPSVPLLLRGPVYPLFIAFCLTCSSTSVYLPLFLQQILSSAAVTFPLWLESPLMDRRFTVLAAVALAIDPLGVLQGNYPMTEGLFIPLWLLALYLATRSLPGGDPLGELARSMFTGMVIGVACLVRPVAQAVIPGALLLVLWPRTRLLGVAFLAGLTMTLSPWLIRNWRLGHQGLTVGAGMTLLVQTSWHKIGGQPLEWEPDFSLPWARMNREDRMIHRTVTGVRQEMLSRGVPQPEFDKRCRDLAFRAILSDPVRSLSALAKNGFHLVVDFPLSLFVPGARDLGSARDLWKVFGAGPSGWVVPGALWLGPLSIVLPLASIGAAAAWRAREPVLLVLLLGSALLGLATIVGNRPEPRYRLPLHGPAVCLAAAGATVLSRRRGGSESDPENPGSGGSHG